jgi:hypothetical protein
MIWAAQILGATMRRAEALRWSGKIIDHSLPRRLIMRLKLQNDADYSDSHNRFPEISYENHSNLSREAPLNEAHS